MITGKQLKDARTLRGLRREDVAALVGVHVKTVSNWERGQVPEAQEHRVRRQLFADRPLAWVSNETLMAEVLIRLGQVSEQASTTVASLHERADVDGWVRVPAPAEEEAVGPHRLQAMG